MATARHGVGEAGMGQAGEAMRGTATMGTARPDRRCTVRRGRDSQGWTGNVRRGSVRRGGEWPARRGDVRRGNDGDGMAGVASLGAARRCLAGPECKGRESQESAWPAALGLAGPRVARPAGKRGREWQCRAGPARHCKAWNGRHGMEGRGLARFGEERFGIMDVSKPTQKPDATRHDDSADSDVFTEAEIATKLKVSLRQVHALIRRGELEFMPVSTRVRRVTQKQFDDYKARKEAEGSCQKILNELSTQATSASRRRKKTASAESAATLPPGVTTGLELIAQQMQRKPRRE